MRSKFQKQSALKLVDRIILPKHGYNIPPLGAELGSRACPGVHTRDCLGILRERYRIALRMLVCSGTGRSLGRDRKYRVSASAGVRNCTLENPALYSFSSISSGSK